MRGMYPGLLAGRVARDRLFAESQNRPLRKGSGTRKVTHLHAVPFFPENVPSTPNFVPEDVYVPPGS
jgi:hypothetical protein